jgi:RNA polymerase sigma-70 factor (sigma-E family)
VRRQSWAAFDEFVRVHGDSLIRLAYVLCGDRGRAEDATQDALTRLYQRWERLDDPLPYARRCVVNATKDHWRRASRRDRREQLAAQWQPPGQPALIDEAVVDRDRLVRALRRLPHGQRAVIVLRYWHDLPEPEVAEILGNSVGTVKSQASRALGRLRAELHAELASVNSRE